MEREEFLSSILSGQVDTGFVNLNWDQSMDPNQQFELALSSIVSSPSNTSPPSSNNVVIRELIGRLGSICNSSGEISPHSNCGFVGSGDYNNSNIYTSGYNTPINSPPKLGLSIPEHHHQNWGNLPIAGYPVPLPTTAHLGGFVTDPGFAERAARFSSFGSGRGYVGLPMPFVPPDVAGKLSRVSSSKSLRTGGCGGGGGGSQHDDGEVVGKEEEPSISNHGPVIGGGNGRKRKGTSSKGKFKELVKVSVGDDDSNAKKNRSNESKLDQSEGVEEGECSQEQGKENISKPSEPPKQDYIHVRARRGQATDSHSLAERVRREKISERMKFLQDLVPGCNKVTGKALMLDEIINYVQSLQGQVEFLSMKLATIHPQTDLKMENLVQKDMHFSFPQTTFPAEASGLSFPFPRDNAMRQSVNLQSSALDGFADDSSLIGVLWEDDLNSVVKMGFGQNLDGSFPSHHLPGGQLPAARES